MKPITYTLRDGGQTSDNFYSELQSFTDELLQMADIHFSFETEIFMNFLSRKKLEKLRTKEEYFFEFLMIGVLWMEYSGAAVNLARPPQKFLAYLVELRNNNRKIKKYVDYLRGFLSTTFLYTSLKRSTDRPEISFCNFISLIKWLSATGEFKQEVKRLLLWREYFSSIGETRVISVIRDAVKLAAWFKPAAETRLGNYTYNVEPFLKTKLKSHLWKEDIMFCVRGRVEYHMNIVGSEIMNRAFKDDFYRADKRAILLPACMRALPDGQCKAERDGLDYVCTGCTPSCRVHQLNMMGKKENFHVYIIPHSSDFSNWLIERGVNSGVGTVGVACINNLISGGLELKSLDIPAQCVLLDYCGCKNHWDKQGFSTDLNIKRLNAIMRKEVTAKVFAN